MNVVNGYDYIFKNGFIGFLIFSYSKNIVYPPEILEYIVGGDIMIFKGKKLLLDNWSSQMGGGSSNQQVRVQKPTQKDIMEAYNIALYISIRMFD